MPKDEENIWKPLQTQKGPQESKRMNLHHDILLSGEFNTNHQPIVKTWMIMANYFWKGILA